MEETRNRKKEYLIGKAGGEYIRNALSTKQPRQVFEEIQHTYGIRLPNEDRPARLPVLDLLDLHKVPRSKVYLNLLSHLRDKLIKQIEALPIDQLDKMLESTFPYITHEELREVHLAILKRHPNIPPHFLRQLGANSDLYAICPLQVQRQIWQIDEDLFRDRVFPLLNQYINTSDLDSNMNELLLDEVLEPAKRREQNVALQTLVSIVGTSVTLYNMMLHFFRTLFVNTKNLHFCTMRAEILMALHDAEVAAIYDVDPCHQFAWCLDACVRDNTVETRRIKEMQSYFDAIPGGDAVLGDLAMIINDPYAAHTLIRNIFNLLVEIVDQEELPNNNPAIKYISQLLLLGLHAPTMIEHQNFAVPTSDTEIITTFYPMVAMKILDDMVREEDEPPSPLEEEFLNFFHTNELARKVALYYLLTRVQAKDVLTVQQLLPLIDTQRLVEEPAFVQSLITQLIAIKEPPMRVAVIDEFYLQHIHDTVITHKQFIRYLMAIHARLSVKDLIHYLQRATSNVSDRERVRPVYESLLERIGQRLNEHNALFLYEYLGLVNSGDAATPTTATTTTTTTNGEEEVTAENREEEEEEQQPQPQQQQQQQKEEEGSAPMDTTEEASVTTVDGIPAAEGGSDD